MSGLSDRTCDLSAPRLVRSAPLLATALLALVISGCTSSSAQPESPPASAESSSKASAGRTTATNADTAEADARNGIVRIKPESQPYVGVEEVAANQTDSTLSVPAHVEFGDGAVSQVGAPLDGRILRVHVIVGQKVHAGDPLLTLDCPDATGSRAAALVADASLREANLELERQRRMQKEGVGIERDLVAAETKVAAAEAEVKREEAVNASLGTGTAGTVVVKAPIDGVITTRKANVGMSVERGGEPLVEIGDPAALRVVADVFERDLSGILPGANVEFTFASTDHVLHGKVAGQNEVVGSGLRTASVFLSIDGKNPVLRPGMYGRAKIELADASITLPVSAVLIKDGRDSIVYVQRDAQTFERRSVRLSQPVEGRVQVLSGLQQGDKVVVRGALLLDGAADQLL